jgi:hypothetical protein
LEVEMEWVVDRIKIIDPFDVKVLFLKRNM